MGILDPSPQSYKQRRGKYFYYNCAAIGIACAQATAVREEKGGVRSGPGAARTILLFHIIRATPSEQLRMVVTAHTVLRLEDKHARDRLRPDEMHRALIKSIEPSVDWRLVVAWFGLVMLYQTECRIDADDTRKEECSACQAYRAKATESPAPKRWTRISCGCFKTPRTRGAWCKWVNAANRLPPSALLAPATPRSTPPLGHRQRGICCPDSW